jgi:hypothetical protein
MKYRRKVSPTCRLRGLNFDESAFKAARATEVEMPEFLNI